MNSEARARTGVRLCYSHLRVQAGARESKGGHGVMRICLARGLTGLCFRFGSGEQRRSLGVFCVCSVRHEG